MPFLDRLSKSVGRAAEQAKFEADKMVRVNKLNSEVSELGKQMEQITMQVGRQVVEMYRAGTLQVPQLSDQFMQLSELEKQLDTKKGDLDAAKATRFEDVSGPATPEPPVAATPVATPTPPAAAPTWTPPAAPVATPPPATKGVGMGTEPHCTNCGEAVTPGTKFCPSCGAKQG